MRIHAAIAAAIMLASPANANDAVSSAFQLCRLLDGTGLTAEKCEVSGWKSSITTTIDMSSNEARQLCAQIAGMGADHGWTLAGWTLNIRSPYSGSKNIALCDLS